jgi:hypothetical protein
VTLSHEVECDEAYVIAGHKGQPEMVQTKRRTGRRRRLKGKCGRGTLAKERPPIFGLMQRCGQVVINMLANVKQKPSEPLIKETIAPGTRIYTHVQGVLVKSVDFLRRLQMASDTNGTTGTKKSLTKLMVALVRLVGVDRSACSRGVCNGSPSPRCLLL